MTRTNRELVIDNLAGFDRLDYEYVANGYAEDGILHFMQRDPIQGRAAILAFFVKQFELITNTRIEVTNVVDSGDLVMVERIDHYDYQGIPVSCPVANATELKNGQITFWREYYDRRFAAKQVEKGLAERS